MTAPVIIDVDPENRPAWREARRQGIGSSDAAAILGMDRFSSAWDVYVDKIEDLVDEDQSAALEWGHRLEPVIAEKFADDHPEFWSVKPTCMFRHGEHPFIMSNPDRLLLTLEHDPETGDTWPSEPVAINECKSSRLDEDWDGDYPPDRVLIQCQHQGLVHNLDTVYVSALLHGREYREFIVPRDDAVRNLLVEVEAEFWQRVEERRPPAVDGTEATSDALKRLYAEPVPESEVSFGDEVVELFTRRSKAKAEAKAAKTAADLADNELRALFGNATTLLVRGEKAATWNSVSTSRFDQKRFAEDHPELLAEYRVPSSYRRLDVKKGFK